MKKTKFFFISIVLILISVSMLTTLFPSTINASNVKMPGIETIINDNSEKEPFQILEIADKETEEELGYYVEGQEPYIKNYQYGNQTFSSLEEGLKTIEKEFDRKEFAQASDFQTKLQGVIGEDNTKYPLSYKEYKEKYFLLPTDGTEDWNKITLEKTRRVKVKGSYEKNAQGTGDYTKGKQIYYPIREDVIEDRNQEGLYRENIASFSYTEGIGAVSPYLLKFQGITKKEHNQTLENNKDAISDVYKTGYGYYINDYRALTSEIDFSTVPGDESGTSNPLIYRGTKINEYPYYYYTVVSDGFTLEELKKKVTSTPQKEGDITLDKGIYYYWTVQADGKLVKENLYYLQGKEYIPYEDIKVLSDALPDDYEYYYNVRDVIFACRLTKNGDAGDPTSYEYYGWYYPNYRDKDEQYIPITDGNDTAATYYISNEEYSLTKGIGEYDFIPDENDTEKEVEIDSFYYQGGMKNNNWLKQYVFHLNTEEEMDSFQIQITTKTGSQLNTLSEAEQKKLLEQYDLIYVHGAISETLAESLVDGVTQRKYPCIIRCDEMNDKEKNRIQTSFNAYWDDSDSDGNYMKDNVYFVSIADQTKGYGIFDATLHTSFVDIDNQDELKNSGFEEIISYIQEENIYRKIEGLEEIEELISRAKAIEYILNFQYKRVTVEKETINVLDLEPAIVNKSVDTDMITIATVANWLGVDTNTSNLKINITQMTTSEFIGKVEDINGKYDLIYIGDKYKTAIRKGATVWGVTTPNATLVYSHTGGQFTMTNKFAGMLDTENADIKNAKVPMKMSGNDLTTTKVEELKEFVQSGYPVIVANGLVSQNKANATKVDNSSNMYELLNDILSEDNVMVDNNIKQSTLAFYANLEKPQIVFAKDGKPVSAIGNSDGPSGKYLEGNTLEYQFHIEHNSAAVMGSVSYDCQLFVDLNADGVFSEGENSAENLKDIKIYNADGKQVLRGTDGKYHLKLNKEYKITREIPDDYYKLIQWKLQVTSNLSNGEYIRGSEIGYTKKETPADKKPTVKVLQIHSELNKSSYRPTWILTEDANYYKNYTSKYNIGYYSKYNYSYKETKFFDLVRTYIQDFNIDVTTMDVNEYANYYLGRSVDKSVTTAGQEWLSQFDMVIVGFADMQDDIPTPKDSSGNVLTYPDEEDGGKIVKRNPVEGLVAYIQNGNSVLFTHDTTSFVNHQVSGAGLSSLELKWGYNLNSIMRPLVGMDRYGITSQKMIGESGKTLSSILKKGQDLTGDTLKEVQSAANDVAYKEGSNKSSSYAQTYGYGSKELISGTTKKITQVNEGAITLYPFNIELNSAGELDVSETHIQYYQLDLEADDDGDGMSDIVVWYCLTGNNYSNYPNDVRNLYYLYSKGNVLYSGVGHSTVNQEMEKKLFINAIVAAWRAGKSEPEVKFVEEFEVNSSEQTTKYYSIDENKESTTGNIVNNDLELYVTIDDIKMIPGNSENTSSDLKIEFFISDPQGENVNRITEEPVRKIEVDSVQGKTNSGTVTCEKNADGTWKVESGNVYKVNIKNIAQYVEKNGNYETPTIYAKVTSNYQYYGKQETSFGVTSVKLWKRQLFDLD